MVMAMAMATVMATVTMKINTLWAYLQTYLRNIF